jgi:hypothetical protein
LVVRVRFRRGAGAFVGWWALILFWSLGSGGVNIIYRSRPTHLLVAEGRLMQVSCQIGFDSGLSSVSPDWAGTRLYPADYRLKWAVFNLGPHRNGCSVRSGPE